MGAQGKIVAFLVEADFGRTGGREARRKTNQDVLELEAALLLMSQRHVIDVVLVQADDQRRDAAVSRDVVKSHDLEAGTIGAGESRDQSIEIGRLTNYGDDLGGRRFQGQGRLGGLARRFRIDRQTALLPVRRRKDRRCRHGAAVGPGGRHPGRQAAEAEVGEDGASSVRTVLLRRPVAEVQRDVHVAHDRGHPLAQEGLLPVLIQKLLDLGRRDLVPVLDQALDRTELLDQLDRRLFANAANAGNVVRDIADQPLQVDGLQRLQAVTFPDTVGRVQNRL